MSDRFTDMQDWKPKKLRTLRNSLNNRLSSYKDKGENAPVLSSSHRLYGPNQKDCEDLLVKVQRLIKQQKA